MTTPHNMSDSALCIAIIDLLLSQHEYDGYRRWEERFFEVCAQFIVQMDAWDTLILLANNYDESIQRKVQYFAEALSTVVGYKPFDEALLTRKVDPDKAHPKTSFFSVEYHPDRPCMDPLAKSFNLQRGMEISRFQQYLRDGAN